MITRQNLSLSNTVRIDRYGAADYKRSSLHFHCNANSTLELQIKRGNFENSDRAQTFVTKSLLSNEDFIVDLYNLNAVYFFIEMTGTGTVDYILNGE